MKIPVWATVFISGLVGGWIGGVVSSAFALPLFMSTSPRSLAAHWMLVVLLAGVFQAAVTAAVLLVLLPPLSNVRVGFETTFIAVLAGDAVTVVGTLLLLHATIQSNLASGGGVGLAPALGLFSFGLMVVGIVVTSTIIGSAEGGVSGGDRLSGYGGQAYFDEYRKDNS